LKTIQENQTTSLGLSFTRRICASSRALLSAVVMSLSVLIGLEIDSPVNH
jgi:hypothetical protein